MVKNSIAYIRENVKKAKEGVIPTNEKHMLRSIYAQTREECEAKLAVLIVEMKAEIKAEKKRRKQAVSA